MAYSDTQIYSASRVKHTRHNVTLRRRDFTDYVINWNLRWKTTNTIFRYFVVRHFKKVSNSEYISKRKCFERNVSNSQPVYVRHYTLLVRAVAYDNNNDFITLLWTTNFVRNRSRGPRRFSLHPLTPPASLATLGLSSLSRGAAETSASSHPNPDLEQSRKRNNIAARYATLRSPRNAYSNNSVYAKGDSTSCGSWRDSGKGKNTSNFPR